MDAFTFVNQTAEKVAPLRKRICQLHWKLTTTGDPPTAHALAEAEKELDLLFSNPDELHQLQAWQAQGGMDPKLSRQIDLLVRQYLPNQLDEATITDLVLRQTEIENIFHNFRAELDGQRRSDNDLAEILKTERDHSRRKAAWEASKQIGKEAAEKVRELARRRNRAAEQLGFANHFAMSLQLQELSSAWLFQCFDRLNRTMAPAFEQNTRRLHQKLASHFRIAPEAIRPWHYDDPFAQEVPAAATVHLDPYLQSGNILEWMRDFYRGIDLDISDVLERSDLFERPGKSQHAFCLNMDQAQDIRVLANIRPNARWTGTMLHELGHAAYAKNIDPALPYLLRDEAHIFATEAIAMLMERMLYHPHWLHGMCEVPLAEAEGLRGALLETLVLEKLILARWIMVVTRFEKGLYENPDQDLNGLWWRLVKELQGIEKPEGRDAPDWAAKIHIASAPCYYHNYLLGELLAAQLAEALERRVLKKPMRQISFLGVPAIGQWLKEKFFSPGAQWPWQKLVTEVTGQDLSEASFVSQFAGG